MHAFLAAARETCKKLLARASKHQAKFTKPCIACTMGWQSYVIPYETEEQLEKLLDLCKLHNNSPAETNVFVRYHARGEFQQISTGEELVNPCTASFKRPYKRPRNGPVFDKVLLVGNGGGRGCTFRFFTYHCRRLFPHAWDASTNGGMRIDAYSYDGMERRLQDKVAIPEARIAGNGDEVLDSDYDVRPALMVTMYDPRSLVQIGEMSEAEAAAAGQFVFKSVEEGYAVDDKRFADGAEAEAHSIEKKAELAQHRKEATERRVARTKEYFDNRAAGKRLYRMVSRFEGNGYSGERHSIHWCTSDEASIKRSEPGVSSVEPATSLFLVTSRVGEKQEQCTKRLRDDEVDAILAAPDTVSMELF